MKAKPKVTAKSILVFDVKVYEEGFDLDALAAKVFELQIEGLVWSKSYKKVNVAYTIQALQVGCVI